MSDETEQKPPEPPAPEPDTRKDEAVATVLVTQPVHRLAELGLL
jgi:hypothetical protein